MAKEHIKHWTIGDVKVTRIVEVNAHQDPLAVLLEGGTPELMKQYDWLRPHFATEDGDMLISFQCFVVKTPKEVIMVDTCIGNDRKREYDVFCNLRGSFLEDMAALVGALSRRACSGHRTLGRRRSRPRWNARAARQWSRGRYPTGGAGGRNDGGARAA